MYEVTAEFYDLLQATAYLRTAERLLDRWLGEPSVGILDVGAGTGLVTALLARRCNVPVHAIEPTPGMRAIMLSRLAGRPGEMSKVRVHAKGVADLGLARVADFAWCFNTFASLGSAARAAALTALATALVPGGTLVLQRPPATASPGRKDLPAWDLGGDRYSGEVITTPIDDKVVEWRFVYRVCRSGIVIREESEAFTGYLDPLGELDSQLAEAGFAIVDGDKPAIVIARRLTRPGSDRKE